MLEPLKKDYVCKATIEVSPGHTQAAAGLTFIGSSQVLTAWEQGEVKVAIESSDNGSNSNDLLKRINAWTLEKARMGQRFTKKSA